MSDAGGARRDPSSWVLWHPQEGLWSWGLLRALKRRLPIPLYKLVAGGIIAVDSAILALRAVWRRFVRLGPFGLLPGKRVPPGLPILYFDLGTHREAAELRWVVDRVLRRTGAKLEAYGFEASLEYVEAARARLGERENVHLIHAALCRERPRDGKLRLYAGRGDGLGSSLYREAGGEYQEVTALRFSAWLRASGLDLAGSVCLLRMNIEGAEFDVVRDLVDSGLSGRIDGYFGMWDDVSKIDPQRGDAFRGLLGRHGISPFTFNGRDLRWRLRRWCIQYELRTSVLAGMRRVASLQREPRTPLCVPEAS